MSLSGAGALAQDSVSSAVGASGNDALSSAEPASQRVRYVVDLVQVSTSWNNPLLVGPVFKASRDSDPMFTTHILGSAAVSPTIEQDVSFPARSFSLWSTPGAGVHPTSNSAPGSTSVTGFASQFGVVMSDFSLAPSSVVGATVGRVSGEYSRLYVERVVAASSRLTPAGPDSATLSVGGIDALGNVALRADAFNTLSTTTSKVLGDNVVRVNLPTRGAGVNVLVAAGTNTSTDTGATTYIVNNEATPTNTPSVLNQPGVGSFGLVYDFAGRFRAGSGTTSLLTTGSHIPAGMTGHRGNPSYSAITILGGPAGTVCSIAMPTGAGAKPNTLMAFGVDFGVGGAAPSPVLGTAQAYAMPASIAAGSFVGNSAGSASFKQYLSQTPWRGGNGQVGVGKDAAGNLILAGTATDPALSGESEFVAVAKVTPAGVASWSVAAHPGMIVRSGFNGASVGELLSTGLKLSAPGVDYFGNVYFVGTWTPTAGVPELALFKSVNAPGGYQLEAMLRQSQAIAGANSGRSYTISSLALSDSDSVASGSMFSQGVLQPQDPAAQAFDAKSIRAFGGVVVAAVISYNNAGFTENYDALLYLGPTAGTDCRADFNRSGAVSVQDIFDFLAAWFAGDTRADTNASGTVTVQDIFDFLAMWFAGC